MVNTRELRHGKKNMIDEFTPIVRLNNARESKKRKDTSPKRISDGFRRRALQTQKEGELRKETTDDQNRLETGKRDRHGEDVDG